MSAPAVLRRYLAALDAGSVPDVLACFTADGEVVSPLYGTRSAAEFYPALFADSAPSRTELDRVYTDPDDPREVALAFHYAWTLADGTPTPFDVVDLVTLTDDRQRIVRLRICYDTAPLRSSWQRVSS
ncbi:nuclear transport factor 2 family protein [Actinomycetospora termitidis]|uniref:Nuclear transport factor 2 family protein n=1 Tax=Actinomycetospora termitidis TaxID=3053470 RepID=A0ABT7MEH3_9PSEU|nr:nuclear transport factor 2 family protein [Actinomycetospora sp. Odt1-22]MDL5158397.1 nuclear transport factor 2 family protein [Actinomycetospora sp. Odt1-22]